MPPRRPSSSPTVVLVGRPNVGKSTLFNRITDSRRAIVTAIAGTTRDVNSLPAEWQGTTFRLVDTGGMFGASEDPLHELVVIQGRKALQEADVLVFVVDGREGLVSGDEEIAGDLRFVSAPVVIAVNKTDDKRARGRAVEFYQLGFDTIVEVAAEHGQGSATSSTRSPHSASRRESASRGGPGGNRSSNRRSAERGEILVAQPVAARGAIDRQRDAGDDEGHRGCGAEVAKEDIPDCRYRRDPAAGPGARSGQLEAVSVIVAKRAIEKADVAVLVVDSVEGATDQDATIAGEADKAGAGIIIVANKWDLMKGRGTNFSKEFDDKLRRQLKFLDYAQVLHISAITGERTAKVLETVDKVADARKRRIPTSELNRFVAAVTAVHPPASPGRREVRILYAAQTGVAPPTFVFFTNVATEFHFSYERFLVNRLRESFGLIGTPIRIHVRRREK